jgi:hypothetical protein
MGCSIIKKSIKLADLANARAFQQVSGHTLAATTASSSSAVAPAEEVNPYSPEAAARGDRSGSPSFNLGPTNAESRKLTRSLSRNSMSRSPSPAARATVEYIGIHSHGASGGAGGGASVPGGSAGYGSYSNFGSYDDAHSPSSTSGGGGAGTGSLSPMGGGSSGGMHRDGSPRTGQHRSGNLRSDSMDSTTTGGTAVTGGSIGGSGINGGNNGLEDYAHRHLHNDGHHFNGLQILTSALDGNSDRYGSNSGGGGGGSHSRGGSRGNSPSKQSMAAAVSVIPPADVYERLALRGRLKAEAKYNWQLPESTVRVS